MVPSQPGLRCHRHLDGIDHLLRNLQHLGNVLQHAGPSTFACHLLHWAAKVQVYHVRSGLFHNLCRFDHRIYITSVNLDAYGTLLVADRQLFHRRLHITHQGFSRHEFRIDHRGTKAFAQHAETDIRHVLHRSQKDGTFT